MADLATLQTRLAEAETALHALATGARTVRVTFGERSVEFSQATIGDLRAYVAQLRTEIADAAEPSISRAFTISTSRGLS